MMHQHCGAFLFQQFLRLIRERKIRFSGWTEHIFAKLLYEFLSKSSKNKK